MLYMAFHFLNLEKVYICIILTVLSCLYYYIRVLYFQNLDMTKEQLYTEIFLLYFEYDDFLT